MKRAVFQKFLPLLMALCLMVTSAYAACMACNSSPVEREFTLAGSCGQKSFDPCNSHKSQGGDCCKGNDCTDTEVDQKAFSRRITVEKVTGLVVLDATSSSLAPLKSYTRFSKADSIPISPQDRTYLQHCSFLC